MTKQALIEIRIDLEKLQRDLSGIMAKVEEQITSAQSVSEVDSDGFKKPPKPSGNPLSAAVLAWEKWELFGEEFTIGAVREMCNKRLTNPAFYHVLSRWEKLGFLTTHGHGMGAIPTKYKKVKAR